MDLKSMKYAELQKLAKCYGIKGNQKSDKLIEALKELLLKNAKNEELKKFDSTKLKSKSNIENNFIVIPEEKQTDNCSEILPTTLKTDGSSVDAINKEKTSETKKKENEAMAGRKSTPSKLEQTKISDYYQVRRSGRANQKELKQKERDELQRLIITKGRELDEDHLKVEEIEGKGRGVLACRLFSRGEFVVEYAGDLIELSTAKQRESKYQLSPTYGCYMYYFNYNNKHYCIDATEETGRLGRLVNHSRLKPNCGTRVVMVDNIPRLILVALKRIQEGEEILYDYGDRSKESLLAHPWLAL